MKKVLLALAIASASLLTLGSCTKEYITNYLPGVSYVYPIESGDWSYNSGNRTFEVEINMPDLDSRYFEDGHVSVAISYDDNPTAYEIIPAVIENYEFSANYSIGKVRIYARDIGSGSAVRPSDLITKIVLTDNEIGN